MKPKKDFGINKKIDFTGERIVPDKTPYMCFQQHINRYHFASHLCKNKLVLDVACGTGYGSDYLIKNGAKNVTGLDISAEAIDYAKYNYKNPNLTFIVGDATKLPFKNEYFDIIVSFETIEHINEYKKFLEECKRVLKKGGVFVCSTPNKRFNSKFLKKQLNPFHVIEFYPEEFQILMNNYFHDTKLYGQYNINVFKRKFIIFGDILISIVPHGYYFLDKLRSILSLNKNSTENKLTIDEYYKVTNYQNTKLKMSEFIISLAKKL